MPTLNWKNSWGHWILSLFMQRTKFKTREIVLWKKSKTKQLTFWKNAQHLPVREQGSKVNREWMMKMGMWGTQWLPALSYWDRDRSVMASGVKIVSWPPCQWEAAAQDYSYHFLCKLKSAIWKGKGPWAWSRCKSWDALVWYNYEEFLSNTQEYQWAALW